MAYLCAVQEHFIGRGKVKCPVLFAGQILAWNVVCSSSLHLVLFFLNDKIRSHPQKRREFYCQSLLLLTKGCLSLPEPEHSAVTSKRSHLLVEAPVLQSVPGLPNPTGLQVFVLTAPTGLDLDLGFPKARLPSELKEERAMKGKKPALYLAEFVPRGTLLWQVRYQSPWHPNDQKDWRGLHE